MDANKVIPKELQLFSLDKFLYKSGVNIGQDHAKHKWLILFHPIISFTISLVFCIQRAIVLVYGDNQFILQVLGDVTEVIGLKFHLNVCFILLSFHVMFLQLVFYRNYKIGVKPHFLQVFEVMTASIPPKVVGLTEQKEIQQLVSLSKQMFGFLDFNVKNNPFVCITFTLTGYYMRAELWEIIMLGVPYSILTALWALGWWNVVGFQFVAFYVICRYLLIKINKIKTSLLVMSRTCNYREIMSTLNNINKLFSEIDDYNSSYFSKFLLSFWLFLGSVIVLSLYQTIFSSARLAMKITMAYIGTMYCIIFFTIIFSASSINHQVDVLNLALRKLSMTYAKSEHKNSMTNKIRLQIKMSTVIGRIADDKVGFTCWKLFTIDYFKCYEIISWMAVLFLKMLEMSFRK